MISLFSSPPLSLLWVHSSTVESATRNLQAESFESGMTPGQQRACKRRSMLILAPAASESSTPTCSPALLAKPRLALAHH
jgi:hypothetical protein